MGKKSLSGLQICFETCVECKSESTHSGCSTGNLAAGLRIPCHLIRLIYTQDKLMGAQALDLDQPVVRRNVMAQGLAK